MFSTLKLGIVGILAASATDVPDPNSPDYIIIASTETVLQKNYPKESVAAGEEGIVQFRINTTPRGDLGICQVVGTSGYARLDAATCDLLIGKTLFKRVVKNGKAVRGDRFGQVNWILPAEKKAAGSAPPKSSASEIARAGEALFCHYSETTGSLVKRTKQCMRGRDYVTMQQMYQQEIDRMKMNTFQTTN